MFIQRDPIGLLGGYNVFAYAPNSIHWVDVLGLLNYRDKFWNRVGQADRKKYQVHHIIPQAVFSGGTSGQYKTASAILNLQNILVLYSYKNKELQLDLANITLEKIQSTFIFISCQP